jgi:hypothetical protein
MTYTLPIRIFSTIPGKGAFGSLKTIQTAGDYISNKKAKKIFCNTSLCRPYNKVTKQSDLMMLRKVNNMYRRCGSYYLNKTDLSVNLITKVNLTGVKVIASQATGDSPTSIIEFNNSTASYLDQNPYYVLYKVDPCGSLFGNNVCGFNNYQDFVEYNPPYDNNVEITDKYHCNSEQ